MHIQWTTVAPNSQPHYWQIKSRIQTIATVREKKALFYTFLSSTGGVLLPNSKSFDLTTLLFTTTQPFYGLFSGPPGWAGARKKLPGFMVQGKINRGRHTDSPDGHHSIRTKQCPPPPSPIFLQAGCPYCRPTNSVKALKATSAFRLGRRR